MTNLLLLAAAALIACASALGEFQRSRVAPIDVKRERCVVCALRCLRSAGGFCGVPRLRMHRSHAHRLAISHAHAFVPGGGTGGNSGTKGCEDLDMMKSFVIATYLLAAVGGARAQAGASPC